MSAGISFPDALETAHLTLRRYRAVDAMSIVALMQRNRRDLMRNFAALALRPWTQEDAMGYVQEASDQWNSAAGFHFGIWRRSTAELIGQLRIKNIVWEVPAAEISYFVSSEFQRQGIAGEALSALLDAAFTRLGFKRIYARIIRSNGESRRLAERLGFKHEGAHSSGFKCGYGELHDVDHYAITRR
jgi:RimJ/RimL family protein N-acetyltransferase